MALQMTAIHAQSIDAGPPSAEADHPGVVDAQRLFYTARYEAAAAAALALRSIHPDEFESYEIRSSALHFQIKNALRDRSGRAVPFKQCTTCPALLKEFLADIEKGQSLAHARLTVNPRDETALFFLGKFDLNYLWMYLGTLGRRTGWSEFWEARRSLDAVLKSNPHHVRAKVARAWMEYIVATKASLASRWLLGGGNKNRALAAIRDAAQTPADFFVHVEAQFGLWDMLVRERAYGEAASVARELLKDVPENADLIAFLQGK